MKKGQATPPETRAKQSMAAKLARPRTGAMLVCVVCSADFYADPSTVSARKCCSMACSRIHRKRPEFAALQASHHLGAKSKFWKGGVTPLNKIARESFEGKAWSRAVKERDNFTCQECGQRGGRLHSDHIVPFSVNEDLRWVLENGRTLCESCHRLTPTYGGRMLRSVA